MSSSETNLDEVAKERLRVAVSRAVSAFVTREATAEQFSTWAGIVESFADRIEGEPPGSVLWGLNPRGVFGVSGLRSRLPIDVTTTASGDRVEGVVTFGLEHEGHKGFAHGGVTASLFDEIFGLLWILDTPPKVTSELTVSFRTLVPLGKMVRVEAQADSVDGNRFACSGRMFDDETVYAEASGVFVGTRRAKPD
ncbi:MAG: PaaI family thioesterase [bacterium]